jgi:hypothetical protein
MDRDDPEQEGTVLPPISATRMIARDEARKVILEHLTLCPFAAEDVAKRVRAIEITLGRLIGFMLGSGALGGLAGAATAHFLK